MPQPIIKEIIVIAPWSKSPSSAVTGKKYHLNIAHPMTPKERHEMFLCLDKAIYALYKEAEDTYEREVVQKETDDTIKNNYVVRLSTNEFFFYTQEPLTLPEFTRVCEKIINYAEFLYPGIHLILGSFAVVTAENQVMNVTPYIQCGEGATIHLLVKNHTSSVDLRYQIPDGEGNTTLLQTLDIRIAQPSLPSITIKEITYPFVFNNIVQCQTAAKTPFLTAVDICIDHIKGVAQRNMQLLAQHAPQQAEQPLSHIVISNTATLRQENSLVPRVIHVDPFETPKAYSTIAPQERHIPEPLFGVSVCELYDLAAYPILTWRTEMSNNLKALQPAAQLLQQAIPSIKHCTLYCKAQLNLFDHRIGLQLYFATDNALHLFLKALEHFALPHQKNEQHRGVACSAIILQQKERYLTPLSDYYHSLALAEQNSATVELNEPPPPHRPS